VFFPDEDLVSFKQKELIVNQIQSEDLVGQMHEYVYTYSFLTIVWKLHRQSIDTVTSVRTA